VVLYYQPEHYLCEHAKESIVQSQMYRGVSFTFKVVRGVNMQHTVEHADMVIVGNGIAGLTAAVEARRLAPGARIAIITDQCHPTINTPALKQFAIGKLTQEQLLAYPAGTERARRIRVINARVEEINAHGKYLGLRGGLTFGYGSLLIATGSRPNGLPLHLPGRDFDGVHTLHSLQDYLDLRRRLYGVDSAVVIGGGAHASETVMGLLHHGVDVHWLIRGETFLSQMLDSTGSSMVLENVRNAGAKIAMKTEVIGIVGRMGSAVGVITNDNKMIPCQLVLACTGTSPVTTLAQCCTTSMMYGDGIFVDEHSRTNVRDIYAAGDVAARKNPQTGKYATQAQWFAAVLQGRSAAAAMTGHHELTAHSIGVPWHATHLGELLMLTVGNPLHKFAGATILTDRSKKKYCRMVIIGDRLVGYLSIGAAQPDGLAIKSIIDEGLSIHRVKKALLKGKFDARKYLSQRRSEEALDMITSGEIPVVKPVYFLSSLPAEAPPYTPADRRVEAPQESGVAREDSLPDRRDSGTARHIPIAATHSLRSGQAQLSHLPSVSSDERRATDFNAYPVTLDQSFPTVAHFSAVAAAADQPTIHGWEHDTGPSTAGAQFIAPFASAKEVESFLLPLPLPSRPVVRSLWSYSEKMPVVKARIPSSQQTEQKQSEKANFLL
jgi:NADPH-dependent 2,4-dienoyl-CoA reductase/sulfur reductase-like enzyme